MPGLGFKSRLFAGPDRRLRPTWRAALYFLIGTWFVLPLLDRAASAIGFHIAFDYMQLFVIGTPNGSHVPVGRLLDVQFSGPDWLTGGALGTEASFLMYPMIAALWLYVWWRYPATPSTLR